MLKKGIIRVDKNNRLVNSLNIEFNTVVIAPHTGYGNGSRLLVGALEDRAIYVQSGSDIVLNFCMPPDYHPGAYTIGYTPWESTEVPRNWLFGLRGVDELWTCCSWSAEVFQRYRQEPVFVLPLGIEDCWIPTKHSVGGPFTFLHVGEPAVRKGGDLVLEAWHKAFSNRKDVKLIYKCIKYPTARVKDRSGSIICSPGMLDNIEVIGNVYTQDELLSLYRRSHCMVYPSRGEGFGLIPFEAMGSGLPTILPIQGGTGDFANYSPLIIRDSTWVDSDAENIHPGLWMDHSVDEIIYLMEKAMDEYDAISELAYRSAFDIHQHFSWDMVAGMAEDRLDKIGA